MIDIPLVEPDIRGVKSTNWIANEKVMLEDKTLDWIVPNGAPFFAEQPLFKLYNAAGGELLLDRDYFFEEEFQPLCKVTGRSICCFIRLETTILESNDFVTLNYQSIGISYVPRNDLKEWIASVMGGGKPIPFSKVMNIPDTVPSCLHTHSIKTEIGDWYEVTDFLNMLANMQSGVDPTLNAQVSVVGDSYIPSAKSAYMSRMAALVEHDKNYNNPHGAGKADLDLGNVDNFATASVADDAAGIRNDLFSTPAGAIQVAKNNIPNSDSLMLQGLMPISRYAGDNYIPPAISGSFEGMGCMTDASGICLERNGELVILSNHMDGRVNALYYSIISGDFTSQAADFKYNYTLHQYQPPSLEAIGIIPNRIISGSGNKVIMVGQANTNNWYIALSNGTFDPGYHSYVKCDMSAVENIYGSPYDQDAQAVIHHMEEWLVLVQSKREFRTDTGTLMVQRFFRVKTDDVRNNLPVAWELIKVTYTDTDGAVFTNSNTFIPVTYKKSDQYHLSDYGSWHFPNPPRWVDTPPRVISLSRKKPGVAGVYNYRVIHRTGFGYNEPPVYLAGWGMYEMLYEFNPSTGVMTLIQKPAPDTLDFLGPSSELTKLIETHPYFVAMTSTDDSAGNVAMLDNGHVVIAFTSNLSSRFPVMIGGVKFSGVSDQDGLMTTGFNVNTHPFEYYYVKNPLVQPPIVSGTYPGGVVYEPDGEIFDAIDQRTGNRQMFFRKVTGNFEIRPEVNNLFLGDLNARPLSNDVYYANLSIRDGLIGITGTDAELTAGGAEQGSTSLSMCAWSFRYPNDYAPFNRSLRAPASANVLMSFPRTYTKALDAVNKTMVYTPETFYGLRQNIVDKLKTYVPVGYDQEQWSFTIYVLGSENGGMFHGLNMALMSVNIINSATGQFRTRHISANLVIDPPGGDHPGVYLITDFTVLSAPPHVRSFIWSRSTGPDQFFLYDTLIKRPKLYGYRDGNTMKVSFTAGFYAWSSGGYNQIESIFDLDLTTGAITNIASGGLPWGEYQGDFVVMIPRVGMSDVTLVANDPDNTDITITFWPYVDSGGAAGIYKKGTSYYLMGSVYPAVGWTFNIPDDINAVINGAHYIVKGGTFDLRDVSPDPTNKTFYLYLTIEDATPKYVLSTERLRKTLVFMRVATLTTNDKQIVTIEREQPTMLGDYLISFIREGGIIPISAGFPQDEGDFIFFHNSELLT